MDVMEKSSNGKRLIDANALLDEFLKRYTERERNGNLVFAACEIKQDFADMISNVPNVYAVEVVRCRECKHCDPENHHCDHYMGTVAPLRREPDGFCSYGERKDSDATGGLASVAETRFVYCPNCGARMDALSE